MRLCLGLIHTATCHSYAPAGKWLAHARLAFEETARCSASQNGGGYCAEISAAIGRLMHHCDRYYSAWALGAFRDRRADCHRSGLDHWSGLGHPVSYRTASSKGDNPRSETPPFLTARAAKKKPHWSGVSGAGCEACHRSKTKSPELPNKLVMPRPGHVPHNAWVLPRHIEVKSRSCHCGTR
jgi:hypothetical protein